MKHTRQTEDWQTMLGVVVVAALLAIIFSGCGESKPPIRITTKQAEYSGDVKDVQRSADELRADVAVSQAIIKNMDAQEQRILDRERRARMETLASTIQWFAAIAALGGAVITALSFFNPAMRPLRALASCGGGAALLLFGLAGYLPDAAELLKPMALVLSVGGGVWIIYRQWVTGSAAAGAIDVAEELKLLIPPGMSRQRKDVQITAVGTRSQAVDEVRKALGHL